MRIHILGRAIVFAHGYRCAQPELVPFSYWVVGLASCAMFETWQLFLEWVDDMSKPVPTCREEPQLRSGRYGPTDKQNNIDRFLNELKPPPQGQT